MWLTLLCSMTLQACLTSSRASFRSAWYETHSGSFPLFIRVRPFLAKQIFTWCKSITQATSRLGFGLQLVTVVLPDWKHRWLSIPENIWGWFSHLRRVVRLASQAVCGGNTTFLRIVHYHIVQKLFVWQSLHFICIPLVPSVCWMA